MSCTACPTVNSTSTRTAHQQISMTNIGVIGFPSPLITADAIWEKPHRQ